MPTTRPPHGRLAAEAGLLLLVALAPAAQAHAPSGGDPGHRLVGLLDYIAVDYGVAVEEGEVVDEFEFEEMSTLVDDAHELAEHHAADAEPLHDALDRLDELIAERATHGEVRDVALKARRATVDALDLTLHPSHWPDRERGEALYAQHCSACHGARGRGDGPRAEGMEPQPTAFREPSKRRGLSPYRVFNVSTHGIEGTPMRAFDELSDTERWDVAFYVMALAHGGEASGSGEPPEGFEASLERLAEASDERLADAVREAGVPDERVAPVVAKLRTETPFGRRDDAADALATARRHLEHVEGAWEEGHAAEAREHAVAAYLEGFEPLEGRLRAAGDGELVREAEKPFMALRDAIDRSDDEAVHAAIGSAREALDRASEALGGSSGSWWAIAFASLVILLREGVEVVLLLTLLLGVLTRLGRPEAKRWVHVGWMAALAAGGVTWFLARHLVHISGAGRELLEGVVALLAAVVLFSVSYWFVSRLQGQAWLGYLKQRLEASASGGRLLALAGLSFLAVYREAFETVLFYQALLLEGDGAGGPVLAGIGLGAIALAVVALGILRGGARLPLKPFFAVSGGLLYALSVVLVGSGVHALVEAGVLPSQPVPGPSVPWLGVHPQAIGLVAQGALVAAAAVWTGATLRRGGSREAEAGT